MSPFVLEDIRKKLREIGFGEADAVGDLCFIAYAEMMRRWNESPRWTTIHYIKKEFVLKAEESEFLNKVVIDLTIAAKLQQPGYGRIDNQPYKFDRDDVIIASSLAFDVFMAFHGIPYEIKKKEENGDIF